MANRFSLRELLMLILIVALAATIMLQQTGHLGRPSQQEVVDRLHELFYDSEIWMSTRWLGIPTAQNPNDVWIHQEVIFQVKPDFIVETGTWHGGSAALWATILQQVNPDGRVISLDINDNVTADKELPIVKERVEIINGSCVDPVSVVEVIQREQWR